MPLSVVTKSPREEGARAREEAAERVHRVAGDGAGEVGAFERPNDCIGSVIDRNVPTFATPDQLRFPKLRFGDEECDQLAAIQMSRSERIFALRAVGIRARATYSTSGP